MAPSATARLRALLEDQLAELSTAIDKEVAAATAGGKALPLPSPPHACKSLKYDPGEDDDEEGTLEGTLLSSGSTRGNMDGGDDGGDDEDGIPLPPLPAVTALSASTSWRRHRMELQHAMDPGFLKLQQLFRGWRVCSRPRLALHRRRRYVLRWLYGIVVAKRLRERAAAADEARALRKGLRRLRARVACRHITEQLAAAYRASVRVKAFQAWRAELRLRGQQQRRARRLVVKCLAAWRRHVVSDKWTVGQLGARLRLKRTWRAMLRAREVRTRHADAAICRLAVLRTRRCLARWHVEAHTKARLRRIRGSMAATLRVQLMARRGLAALKAHVQAEEVGLQNLAQRTQQQAVRARAVTALWRLRGRVVRRQRAEVAARRLLEVVGRHRLREWRVWTLQRAWERAAVAAQGRRAEADAVRHGLLRWHMRARLQTAAASVEEGRRRQWLGTMRRVAARSRDLQTKGRAVARRNVQRRLRGSLAWWWHMARFAERQRGQWQQRAWRRWRLVVLRRGLQRGIEEEVGGGHAAARGLRRGWEAWYAVVARGRVRRILAAVGAAVRGRAQARVARGALLSWRRALEEEAGAKGAELEAAAHWRCRQSRAALTVLVRGTRAREVAARTAAVAQRHWETGWRRKGVVGLQLRRWAVESARLREAMALRWRVRRWVAAWRATAEREREMEEGRAQGQALAQQQWGERRMRVAVGRLYRCVYACVCAAARLPSLAVCVCSCSLKLSSLNPKCFPLHTHTFAPSLARLRWQAQELRRSVLTARRLVAWDAWRAQLATVRGLRRFRQRSERARLRRLLFAWAKLTHGRQRRRAALLREARRERKRKAFAEWHARVLWTQRVRRAGRRVAEAHGRWLLQRAMLGGWRAACKAVRDERRAQQQFLRWHGLRQWVLAVQLRREERCREHVVTVMHARRVAVAALLLWNEARAEAARMHMAILHHARRLVRRRWVDASLPRLLAQSAVAAVADGACAEARLRRGLAQWRERVMHRRRLQLSAHGRPRLARHWRYWRRWLVQQRAWAAWRAQVIQWSIDRPLIYEAIVGLVPSGSKRLAMQAWVAFCARRAGQRESLEDGGQHHALSFARAGIRSLALHARAARAARRDVEQKMAEAERAHLRTGLLRWQKGVAVMRAARLAEADRRRLRKLLRGWAEHVRHMKTARAWLRSNRRGPGVGMGVQGLPERGQQQ